MSKYMKVDNNFKVIEIIEANVAVGFLNVPRDDIQVGDVLTEQEKMSCGLIPWTEPEQTPPTSE